MSNLHLQWSVVPANLDPVAGAEQSGSQPVLIVSNEEFNQAMPNVTVLPLTSTKRQLYPSEVLLGRGKAGQPLDSIVMAHQITTISKRGLGPAIGYVADHSIRIEIRQAMREHLDMD